MSRVPVRRALVSVHDKSGLPELAEGLHRSGVQIVSTGSTAAAIAAAGVPVTAVQDVTGSPEVLGGRVKTLHPVVHAGLLADPANPEHAAALDSLGAQPFQVLVCNLYPFAATVASGAAASECVEQIDIGGPAMLRAAAKNHASVAVVTSPEQYRELLAAIESGGFTLGQRRRLAAQAYAHTAAYDVAVASWFASAYAPDEVAGQTGWPDVVAGFWRRADVLRYGENPHQRAALFLPDDPAAGLGRARQLGGKQMSYNNYVDADAAWAAAGQFAEPCVVIAKHANPCGIALGSDIAEAHRKALAGDPVSAFGGVIAANRPVTAAMAAQVREVFTEVIVAPGYEPDAVQQLRAKTDLRVLEAVAGPAGPVRWRRISGGLLMQSSDAVAEPGDDPGAWKHAAGPPAAADTLADLAFAWRACQAVSSNAILLAAGQASTGIGMGQVNRVDAARLAVARAGDRAAGSVAASDAYFPFADGLQVLTEAGVRAIVQPGGSRRDAEVTEAAATAGVSLYLTGVRHFRH